MENLIELTETIVVPVEESASIRQIVRGKIQYLENFEGHIVPFVDGKRASWETTIVDGQTLELIPLFAGGI